MKVLFARGKLPLYRAATVMLSLFNASFKKLSAIIFGKISIGISRLLVFSESRFLYQNPYFSDGFGTHPLKSAAD